jgi:hypothetical protein
MSHLIEGESMASLRNLLRNCSLLLAGATALGVMSHVPEAEACGGTFCDQTPEPPPMPDPGTPPPEPMPVDQTGETIIFVTDGDNIEAHIQIEYDADSGAERFAWLIPLPAVPEFGISSQELFTRLQLATVPTFGFSSSTDTCSAPDNGSTSSGGGGWGDSGGSGGSSNADAQDDCSPNFGSGSGGSAASSGDGNFTTASGSSGEGGDSGTTDGGDGGSYEGDDDGGMAGEPEVVQHGLVGAFEIFVLEGGTIDGVMTWLETNEFEPNPDAEPIIEDYLNQGHVFVAMKLRPGAGSSAIHPIKLNFPGDEFCVPLKMTAIAARDDMAIRVLVLGEERAAPANWPHVVLNPLAFNWLQLAPEYEENSVLALDEEPASGRAWMTEYAGSSSIVDTLGLVRESWNADAFLDITPDTIVAELESQEIVRNCLLGVCEAVHPLGMSILEEFLPVPEGVAPDDFYACPSCFAAFIDLEAFVPEDISAAVRERIVEPAERAAELIDTNSYLTRLYTRISPHEMLEDPTFHTNPDLGNVPLPAPGARSGHCDYTYDFVIGNQLIELSNPDFWAQFDDMPLAQRFEMIPAVGAPQVLVNNSEKIQESLLAWNTGIAGDSSDGEVMAARFARGGQCSGCGCIATSQGGGGLAGLSLLLLGAWRRRRGRLAA